MNDNSPNSDAFEIAKRERSNWSVNYSKKPYLINASENASNLSLEVFYRLLGIIESSDEGMPFPGIKDRLGKSWFVMITPYYELSHVALKKISLSKGEILVSSEGSILKKPKELPTPEQWMELLIERGGVVQQKRRWADRTARGGHCVRSA